MSISPEIVQLIQKHKTFSQFQKDIAQKNYKSISKQTFYNYKNNYLDMLSTDRLKSLQILKDLSQFSVDEADDNSIHIDIDGEEKEMLYFCDKKTRNQAYTLFINDMLNMDRELNNLNLDYIDQLSISKGKTGLNITIDYSTYDLDYHKLEGIVPKEKQKLKYLDKLSKDKKLYTVFSRKKRKIICYIPYENIIEIKIESNKDYSDDNMLSIYDKYSEYKKDSIFGYQKSNTIRNIRIPIL